MVTIPGAERRPFQSKNKVIVKGDNGFTWNFPHNRLLIGGDWYFEKYEILSKAPACSVVIDIGCKDGCWLGEVHGIVPPQVLRIGIDPINNNVINLRGGPTPFDGYVGGTPIFHKYYQCAIDNVEAPTVSEFNIFDEPGCNSLLPKSDLFIMRNVISKVQVPVNSLESILLDCVSPKTCIYYIKCDCQGKDVDAIKSAKSFLPYVQYIQIEVCFNKDLPMYKDQIDWQEGVEVIKGLGFEPIYYTEYDESLLPEGEIVFKNTGIK